MAVSLLKNLLDGINGLIEDPQNIGKDRLIDAGIVVRRTIEQAQVCYANSLDIKVQGVVTQLETLTKGIIAGQQDAIDKAKTTAQQINNDLPFSDRKIIPQPTTMLPRFVLATDKSIHFIFKGSFGRELASPPVLKFGKEVINPVANETRRLEFDVPYDTVFQNRVLDRMSASLTGTLELLYKEDVPPAIFRVFVRSVPPSPGTIELQCTTSYSYLDPPMGKCGMPLYSIKSFSQNRSVPLKWGETAAFDFPNLIVPGTAGGHLNQWGLKLVFTDFRGKQHDLTAGETTDYLIVKVGKNLTITAPAFTSLPEVS